MRIPVLGLLLFASALEAHVGSPDIYFEGKAGPYPVSIAIRPPTVIPGVAEVEVRASVGGVRAIHVVPFPLVGVASKYPPTADLAKRSGTDPNFYTSSVWMMSFGSYQVRVEVDGAQGHGTVSVPIPSISSETKPMTSRLGVILLFLMTLIAVGLISIAGAAARESTLPEGEVPGPPRVRRSRAVMASASLAVIGILALGNWWWGVEASSYRSYIYVPPTMDARVDKGFLHLTIQQSRWAIRPKLDEYLPDHGHLMHLFVVKVPEMELMWHLHPDAVGKREFTQRMPTLPAGQYKLFADVVHTSGFPETPVADLSIPEPLQGVALKGDDAAGSALPISEFAPQRTSFALPNGYRMVRLHANESSVAKQMQHLAFEVQDSAGQPAKNLEPYMGMAGHAEFLLSDASVFAHVHPSGTVPMSSLSLTAEQKSMPPMTHSMHNMAPLPAQIAFPYGFPKAGHYRMFIQIQQAGVPETAAFDLDVHDPAR